MDQKRKMFWIDAPIQFQLLGFVLAAVSGSVVLVSFMVHRGLHAESERLKQIFFSLDWVDRTMLPPLLMSAAICVLASAVITLLWSHRFAGPLRVLSAAMHRAAEGDLSSPLRVRETDTLKNLIADFAKMQAGLREAVEADQKRLDGLGRKLHDLVESLPKDHSARKELSAAPEKLKVPSPHFKL